MCHKPAGDPIFVLALNVWNYDSVQLSLTISPPSSLPRHSQFTCRLSQLSSAISEVSHTTKSINSRYIYVPRWKILKIIFQDLLFIAGHSSHISGNINKCTEIIFDTMSQYTWSTIVDTFVMSLWQGVPTWWWSEDETQPCGQSWHSWATSAASCQMGRWSGGRLLGHSWAGGEWMIGTRSGDCGF
jgi:hypothetical protein